MAKINLTTSRLRPQERSAKTNVSLKTHKLTSKQPLVMKVPVFGSLQNAVNSFSFIIPRALRSVLDIAAIKTAFAANDAMVGEYDPDTPDVIDYSKVFGQVFANMPIYGSLELGNVDPNSGNEYTGIDGNEYAFSNIIFPIAIVQAVQPKRIVKTDIQGLDGSIKEYIGMGDWQVTINAIVNMPADQAPIDFLNAIADIIKAPVPIPVTNYYLNELGITYLVIEDVNLSQVEGEYSNQNIVITACSDTPLTEFLP